MARKLLVDWCLENGEFGEQLLSQWTGEDINGNFIDINNVSKGANIRLKWHCSKCQKDWVANLHHRTSDKTGCKNCSNLSRSMRTRNATTHKGINDLLTWCNSHGEYGKYIKEEWTGIAINGEKISIEDIAKGSSKKVIWKCNICGEEWKASPSQRTGKNKSGCSSCNTRSTSYPEQFIYYSIKQIFPDAVSRGKYKGYEFDVIISSINTFIEYSPTFTHEGRQYRDTLKANVCKENDIRFIKIIEDSYNEMEHYCLDDEICFRLDYSRKDYCLQKLVFSIVEMLGINSVIDFEMASEMAFLKSHNHIEYEESVEYLLPNLIKEWNTSLNGLKTPSKFTPYASVLVYWTCLKCGYGKNREWKSLLSNRAHLKQGCPACGYNWYDGQVHNNGSTITISGVTDFPSVYPDLYQEWSYELNGGLNPYECRTNSHKLAYWVCQKCDYGKNKEWKRSIDQRCGQKSGCPACGYNWFDGKIHVLSGSSVVVLGVNDLLSQYPTLVKEWHPTLNKKSPQEYKTGSRKKVYWCCPNCGYGENGAWLAPVGDRVHDKTGCPVCHYNWETESVKVITNGSQAIEYGINDIASTDYKRILDEWHPTLNIGIDKNRIRASSHTDIYWECKKCHYGKNGEWKNTLNSRTNQKSGCPICGYNYYFDEHRKTTGRSTVVVGINDLATTHPEYAKEWHPTLNIKSPQEYKAGSHELVYWLCPICGYGQNGEWLQDIHIRLKGKLFCRTCRRKNRL